MNDNQFWFLVQAILHVSKQVSVVDQKVNIILKNESADFSKEDAEVLDSHKQITEALGRIPNPRVHPETN